jgi:hypothetical protein
MDAYNEAFQAIKNEFEALQRVRDGVKEIARDPSGFTIPENREFDDVIEIRDIPVERWRIGSRLLNLRSSEIFLCERSNKGEKEFAVINRFRGNLAYAQNNGDADVLLTGKDPVLLVQDYLETAQHTLRFMAGNLMAKAHKIILERFANTNPARVLRAISERCAEAASPDESERENQAASHG